MAYEAKILVDSICNGYRLTTMQLTHPRIIHAEFNTHCAFARNASSSRAIPFSKMLAKVIEDPFIPERWPVNEKGMQGYSFLEGEEKAVAVERWIGARDAAVYHAKILADRHNVHKQLVNRLLEPWGWITVCVTGDSGAWSNYFWQRCHKDAQYEIQVQAKMARDLYFASTPKELKPGEWHMPYIQEDEVGSPNLLAQVSVARCARTSYLTQEGKRDIEEDFNLYKRLVNNVPMHASPLEHVCQAKGDGIRYAKYLGWQSMRYTTPGEYVTDFTGAWVRY